VSSTLLSFLEIGSNTSAESRDETGTYNDFRLASTPFADITFLSSFNARNGNLKGWKFSWSERDVQNHLSVPWQQKRFVGYQVRENDLGLSTQSIVKV
jgi:hypothetical protein